MPAPTTPRVRRFVKRDELQAALDTSGVATLTRLAELCGVHRVWMSNVANGQEPISTALAAAIRDALGVNATDPVDWLESR